MSRFSGDLTVQAADGTWRLDQQGMLHPKVVIFGATGQIGLSEWGNIQKGGPVTFADGRSYEWASEFTSRGLRDRQFDESSQWWL